MYPTHQPHLSYRRARMMKLGGSASTDVSKDVNSLSLMDLDGEKEGKEDTTFQSGLNEFSELGLKFFSIALKFVSNRLTTLVRACYH